MANKTLIEKVTALIDAGLTEEQALRALVPIQPTTEVNTTKNLMTSSMQADLSAQVAKLKKQFLDEPKEDISIAVPYGKQTGGYVKVAINGQGIELPTDGHTYKVPSSFKTAFIERLKKLDEMDSVEGPNIVSKNSSELMRNGGLVQGDKQVASHSFK